MCRHFEKRRFAPLSTIFMIMRALSKENSMTGGTAGFITDGIVG